MSIYHQTDLVTLYQGDCLEVMPQLEARSFDAIICDLPYGTTACKWDSVIPFEPLWEQYKRLIKPNGAIVLFGSQPFTSMLVMSNLQWFKHEWIWRKNFGSNFLNAKRQPMKEHESVLVFGLNAITYNPQKIKRAPSGAARTKYKLQGGAVAGRGSDAYGKRDINIRSYAKEDQALRTPSSVLDFDLTERGLHPTQKPIALLEYLAKTYTNEGDMILDNTCGSGSLLVAARNTNRRAVGIEMDEGYCRIAAGRLGRFEPSEFEVDKKAVEGQLGLFGAIACL